MAKDTCLLKKSEGNLKTLKTRERNHSEKASVIFGYNLRTLQTRFLLDFCRYINEIILINLSYYGNFRDKWD